MSSQSSPAASLHSPSFPASADHAMMASQELTPRSKVKQMLASLDDDSEEESTTWKSRTPHSPVPDNGSNTQKEPHQEPAISEGDSQDDDSDQPIARRGTLAERMRKVQSEEVEEEQESESDSDKDAYQRIRRRLLSRQQDKREHTLEKDPSYESPSKAASPQASSRAASPGLFISPEKPECNEFAGDHASSPSRPTVPDRLKALAAQKRRERIEQEAADGRATPDTDSELTSKSSTSKASTQVVQKMRVESESDSDEAARRKFTQQAKPTRKASKRAIEEMHRETQRMSRNMQLTHEARTKTKFSTADLFARFNFRQPKPSAIEPSRAGQHASSSSAPQSSDAECRSGHDTPPSSPPSMGEEVPQAAGKSRPAHASLTVQGQQQHIHLQPADDDDDEELPDLQTMLTQHALQHKTEKQSLVASEMEQSDLQQAKRASARRFAKSAVRKQTTAGSDDDLEIVKPRKASRLAFFDQLPASKARESHSLHTLRALAHLHDSEKPRKGQKSLTPSELQTLLHRRAREQALRERDEKIQRLRERGVLVQTAEEKEREQMQIDNMLEKARQEAADIAEREKEAAKRDGKEGEHMLDSDGDEDYQASDEEEVDQGSGSEDELDDEAHSQAEGEDVQAEDEEAGDEEEDDVRGRGRNKGPDSVRDLIDNEASDDDGEEQASSDEVAEDRIEEGWDAEPPTRKRPKRRHVVDSDDEEKEEEAEGTTRNGAPMHSVSEREEPVTPAPAHLLKTSRTSTSDAFGFGNKKPSPPLGLSQVFAGTMAEDQSQADLPEDSQQDSMTFLRSLPAPNIPNYDDSLVMDSPKTLIEDSQTKATPSRNGMAAESPNLFRFETRTQRAGGETQTSELPDPTQDDGFQIRDSQPPLAEASYETVDTVPLDRVASPDKVQRRGKKRLRRQADRHHSAAPSEDPQVDIDIHEASDNPVDAFEAMRQKRAHARAQASAREAFDKKKSDAKGMFEEQAEESEDEYAGLGGASDDESTGEVDEATKNMIDDQSNEKTDERDIAAYYADKERREDEKNVEKLYRDVVNGGLRRKRGAADLWDSDDEDEAASRRRAAKQREFAKMRKALLADEKIGKIAENPKRAAFLQALEDRDDADDLDFLDRPEESFNEVVIDSQQDQPSEQQQQPLSTISANNAGLKRTHDEYAADDTGSQAKENMPPPPNPRRTKATKVARPTSLADIRNTLSDLIGEPESLLESQRLGSPSSEHPDNENEGQASGMELEEDDLIGHHSRSGSPAMTKPNTGNPRRTPATAAKKEVVNRMLKKRSSTSANRSSVDANQTRLAFQSASNTSFNSKVPSLLRRATTNNSTGSLSIDTSAASAAAGGLGGKDLVKRGGSAKSSVNYYVREMERKAKLDKVEKERMDGRMRVGKMRRDALAGKGGNRSAGLGGLVGGSFEE